MKSLQYPLQLMALPLLLFMSWQFQSCSSEERETSSSSLTETLPQGTISGTNVNIREAPNLKAGIITQLQPGDRVTIEGEQDKTVTIGEHTDHWYQISGEFGKGWVFGTFLAVEGETEELLTGRNRVVDRAELCKNIGNYPTCSGKVEAEWIKYYPKLIKRSNRVLSLQLENGNWKEFEDSDDSGDGYSDDVSYFYLIGYYEFPKPGAFLLSEQYYEGDGNILIPRNTGKEIDVISEPVFAASQRNFACFSSDMEAGYNPTGLEIWAWNGGKCIREFSIRDGQNENGEIWGPTSLKWVSENEIRITTQKMKKNSWELIPGKDRTYQFQHGNWREK